MALVTKPAGIRPNAETVRTLGTVSVTPYHQRAEDYLAQWRDHEATDAEPAVPMTPWRRRLILITALAGLASVAFLVTVLGVAQVQIAEEFGAAKSTTSWILTAPLLLNAVAGPIFGKIGDIYGHRRLYLIGFAVSAVFAGLTAASWSLISLIGLRTLSAAAGAVTNPASLAILVSIFPPSERVRAMSYWTLTVSMSPVIGLVLGGPIIEAFGWRWIFIAQMVPALITIALAAAFLPETPRRRGAKLDVAGASTLGLGVGALLIALVQFGPWGFLHPMVIGGLIVGPLSLATFVAIERRVPSPLLPMAYLRRRNYSVALGSGFFSSVAYMGIFATMPFLLDEQFGYKEAAIAQLVMVRPLTFALAGMASGRVTPRVGERQTAVGGMALIALGMGLTALAAGFNSIPLVVIALILSGAGLGFSRPPVLASSLNAVAEADVGVASAFQGMVGQMGTTIGIAGLATIHTGIDGSAGFVAAASAALVAGVIGTIITTGLRSEDRSEASAQTAAA